MENAVKRGCGRPRNIEPTINVFVTIPISLHERIRATANGGATVQDAVRKVLAEKFATVQDAIVAS